MELNFTINGVFDIPNQAFTAKVTSVETPAGDVITEHFLDFCKQNAFVLTTEEAIRAAAYSYGKRFYG
ncbi:MAG TPA: hypothetical protein PLU16_15940 [Gallionellaceae bacterium]|jgi:hypothetical protein|nr:hypothetical protein [Gallionellaceae bacterium]